MNSDIKYKLEQLSISAIKVESIDRICIYKEKELISSIDEALKGNKKSLDYVNLLLKSGSQHCEDVLRANNFQYTLDQIVAVALSEQNKFFAAITSLHKKLYVNDAINYLTHIFSITKPLKPTKSLTPNEPNKYPYKSCHAYGKSAAISFSTGIASDQITHILNVEGTLAGPSGNYDWSRKISIQLNLEEMFNLLALIHFKISSISFANHGQNNDKSLSVQIQKDRASYYAKIQQTNAPLIAVPLTPGNGISISILILDQIYKNAPHLNGKSINDLTNVYSYFQKESHSQNQSNLVSEIE